MEPYHVATDEERGNVDECYDVLIGPNGFECVLGEPEDRRWYRDCKPVVEELNRLTAEVERLTECVEAAVVVADQLWFRMRSDGHAKNLRDALAALEEQL